VNAARLVVAACLVASVVERGFGARSPSVVPVFAVVFTALYVADKWSAWHLQWEARGVARTLASLAVTYGVQCGVVGVLFAFGRGVGSIFETGGAPLGATDLQVAAAVLLVGVGLAAFIRSQESGARAAAEAARLDPLELDPGPLTVETFFVGDHPAPPATPEQIAEAEARLGVTLPPLLRELYARHDGGFVGDLYVPRTPHPRPVHQDWIGAFSIDYSLLLPLAELDTLRARQLRFLEEDDPELIPGGERFVVLVSRYADTTFLDYSRPGPPRARIVDFDPAHPTEASFDTFEEMFAALRRRPR
jgi:tryptophan-rich sensory protein